MKARDRDPGFRVVNLVAFAERFRGDIARLVGPSLAKSAPAGLAQLAGRVVEGVERLCAEQGGSPAELPDPSRRAYLWLRYLADPVRLERHLAALRQAAEVIAGMGLPVTVRLDFYHIGALYRARSVGRATAATLSVTASEGFIAAPREVIADLLRAAFEGTASRVQSGPPGGGPAPRPGRLPPRGRGADRGGDLSPLARVRQWASGEDYRSVLLALERDGGAAPLDTRGRCFDLAEVFERVNAAYFGGRLERPTLVWSRTVTRRKFGHYEPATDTVVISLTLDDPRVPDYLTEFVMFHELLHRVLGVGMVNGRQRAHTTSFRRAERRFAGYEQAKRAMERLAREAAGAAGAAGSTGGRRDGRGRGSAGARPGPKRDRRGL